MKIKLPNKTSLQKNWSLVTGHWSLKRGVTLAELTLVLAIIAVLTAIFTGAYRNQRVQVRFTNSMTEIVSMMKTARNYAVTSRAIFDERLIIPPEGYGVYIERHDLGTGDSKVILFANTTPPLTETESLRQKKMDQYDSGDFLEETYILPIDTDFKAILQNDKTTVIPGNPSRAVIIFRPPVADAYIATNGDPTSITTGTPITEIDTLYLELSRAGAPPDAKKYIKINKTAGFPEVEF